ncbi:RHS repeat protein [Pseudomonas sp. GD04058]|uniref:RHS repeat domain-containing protein n=1 Tax=Pseudomonas sp. GD04058 TaxID=2975429 RepID=UPI00244C468C|nr:RHS repeat-associated core domain-containing protein [Pseudomonas sp. GD04058]MDG9883639.1 RHS repeat protein [Pseudomonas sp. GD04058]
MGNPAAALHRHTPKLKAFDSRGLIVREIAIHRHPDNLEATTTRITRHRYGLGGFLAYSADPRLYEVGRANFTYAADLSGRALYTRSADAGSAICLNDSAGRQCLGWSNVRITDNGDDEHAQVVTRAWQYEDTSLPGRPLAISEQGTDEPPRVVERFVYAAPIPANKALNLAGQCVRHYDPAGLSTVASVGLSGVPLLVGRRLLDAAADPDTLPDWQDDEWHGRLEVESDRFSTLTTLDAMGSVLTTTDAAGNSQRTAYDVSGLVKRCWLTGRDAGERIVLDSQVHSAAGQILQEVHGNGVQVSYGYEEQTQRLSRIRVARPTGHAAGAGVLLDLEQEYDPAGNLLQVTNHAEQDGYWRNQRVAARTTCAYDSLYQLVGASGREMANASRQPAVPVVDDATYTNYSRSYRYDAGGNLLCIRHSSPLAGNNYTLEHTLSERSCRGVPNALASDPAQVEALFTPGGQQRLLQPGQALSWTARGELRKAWIGNGEDHEGYRYDADSQRVLKVTVQGDRLQRVVYLPGLELRGVWVAGVETQCLEVVRSVPAGRTEVRLLHWASGKPAEIANDALRYSYGDLIGSSLLELDGEGRIVSQEEYYPYGGTALWKAHAAETDIKVIRYSGKERDLTGLYYYGYRYYQPWGGRWLSVDPAGVVDGLNLFRMVANNPLGYRDGQGLMMQAPQGAPVDTGALGPRMLHPHEQAQVRKACPVSHAMLGFVLRQATLPESTMSAFFGPDYLPIAPAILNSWKRTATLFAEYSSPFRGYQKFLRVPQGDPYVLASVHHDDAEGLIRLSDRFFHPSVTSLRQSVTLIHELAHLGRVSGIPGTGASALDFFYLDHRNPVSDSIHIVEKGNLTLSRVARPIHLMLEIARFNQWFIHSISEESMTYTDSLSRHEMKVADAIDAFNTNSQLRATVAARNADSLAWAVAAIALCLPRPPGERHS